MKSIVEKPWIRSTASRAGGFIARKVSPYRRTLGGGFIAREVAPYLRTLGNVGMPTATDVSSYLPRPGYKWVKVRDYNWVKACVWVLGGLIGWRGWSDGWGGGDRCERRWWDRGRGRGRGGGLFLGGRGGRSRYDAARRGEVGVRLKAAEAECYEGSGESAGEVGTTGRIETDAQAKAEMPAKRACTGRVFGGDDAPAVLGVGDATGGRRASLASRTTGRAAGGVRGGVCVCGGRDGRVRGVRRAGAAGVSLISRPKQRTGAKDARNLAGSVDIYDARIGGGFVRRGLATKPCPAQTRATGGAEPAYDARARGATRIEPNPRS